MSGPALTSEEVNFLVYRYLLESGFSHSAFTFAHESYVTKANIDGAKVPPGALISFIQKGLQYCEIEAHVNEDGTETVCDAPFSVLAPHTCSVKTRRKVYNPYEPMDSDYGSLEIELDAVVRLVGHKDLVCACAYNPTTGMLASSSSDGTARLWQAAGKESKADTEDELGRGPGGSKQLASATILNHLDGTTEDTSKRGKKKKGAAAAGKKRTDDAAADDEESKGGAGAGAGAGDAKPGTPSVAAGAPSGGTRPHAVVCLEWNPRGSYLACGCYDGSIRIWSSNGQLYRLLHEHTAAVTSVRWSRKGDTLLSASMDGRVIAWDVNGTKVKQEFAFHKAPVLDIDWRNDTQFASVSTDPVVLVCALGSAAPLKRFTGHERDVTCVRWSPSGKFLATGSDDASVKVWTAQSDEPVLDLRDHQREITTLQWSLYEGSNATLYLATASMDGTVRVYEAERGKQVACLQKHAHPVVTLAFDPHSEFLATGSHDRLHIWGVKEWSLRRTFKSPGGITDLSWSPDSKQIAASYSDNSVYVIPLRN